MSERAVFVFDLCSSTTILEELVVSNQVDEYNRLIFSIHQFLDDRRGRFHFVIYKYVGDGFILLFDRDTLIDHILVFAWELAAFAEKSIESFLDECIAALELPRTGITMGLDTGIVNTFMMGSGTQEYTGRPINLSTRLQTSLSEPEHTNKLLISLRARKGIKVISLRRMLKERQRVFRNISGNTRQRCFEFDPGEMTIDQANTILSQYPIQTRLPFEQPTQETFDRQRNLYRESRIAYLNALRSSDLAEYYGRR